VENSFVNLGPLLEKARREAGCEAVALYVNRPEKRVAERVAFFGEEPRPSVPYGVTPLGECAATGIGVHREVKNTKPDKYHSHLYVPLLTPEGSPLGVAWFAAVQPEFFADPEVVTRAQRCAQSLTSACLRP
jgi:hypothetical protein